MPEQPTRMSKSLMNSPYYSNFSGAKHGVASMPTTKVSSGTGSYGNMGNYGMSQTGKASRKVPAGANGVTGYQGQGLSPKQIKKLRRQASRERDYFFVMRKGICFLMFLFCLVIVAVMALGAVTGIPMLKDSLFAGNEELATTLSSVSAIYVAPDNTPTSEREEYQSQVDEEGYYLVYEDTSTYYAYLDPTFGMLKSFGLLGGKAEEEASAETEDVAKNVTEGENQETAEGTEEAAMSFDSPLYDDSIAYFEAIEDENDTLAPIATTVFKYAPVAYVIIFITAFIAMITSFCGMFGRRIYKCFGLAAIIMIVFMAVVVFCGLAILGAQTGAPYYDDVGELHGLVNTDYLSDFLLRSITGEPAVAVDTTIEAAPVPFAMGLGSLIIIGSSAIVLVLSIFARRKLPYSIFDK